MSQSAQQQQNPFMPTSGAQFTSQPYYNYGDPGMQQQQQYAPQSSAIGGSTGNYGKPQGGTGMQPANYGQPNYNYYGSPSGYAPPPGTNPLARSPGADSAPQSTLPQPIDYTKPAQTVASGNPAPYDPTANTGMNANPSWLNFFGGPQAQQNYAQQYAQQYDPSVWGPSGPIWSANG